MSAQTLINEEHCMLLLKDMSMDYDFLLCKCSF